MVATSAKRGRGRPSAGAAKVKSPPKKATGVKAAAKRSRPVRTPAAKTLPAKRKRVKKVIIDSDDGEADRLANFHTFKFCQTFLKVNNR